uniref:DH domain-containing protein n=1 Tax=Anopheles epiroticus TaxID=199890 RepID=A0A182P9Z2_9DIPT
MFVRFAGSSTDIGPSVLGYLDTLANNFSEEAKQLVESSNNKPPQPLLPRPTVTPPVAATVHPLKRVAIHVVESREHSSLQQADGGRGRGGVSSVPTLRLAPPPPSSAELNAGRVKKFSDKFFNLVSPNVQRMVSNTVEAKGNSSVTSSNGVDASSFIRNNVVSASFSSAFSRKTSKLTAEAASPTQVTGHSHKKLPLSKNIAKLTHLHSDPMDAFIENVTTGRHKHRIVTDGDDALIDGNGNIANEKHRLSPAEELQNVSTLQLKIRSLTVDLENGTNPTTGSCSKEADPESSVVLRNEVNNSANIDNAFIENCVDRVEHRNTVVEACNFYPNLGRNVPTTSDDRRKLAEARAKLLDANSNCKASVPNSPKLNPRISNEQSNSTSTPSLDTTVSGSPYSSKASLLIPPNTPVLSSRPLSASSICSYSSSASSSGSEHQLPGSKGSAAGSYQASVESLADHSEPEQIGSGGMLLLRHCDGTEDAASGIGVVIGMTMCERAVREIIDSESNYVKDLGQVIRGYLEDWKERACLKHNQLKVLFSNIQEVYDFNFKLLNRLREARGDPVTISNCFIDLHAEFSCYTTYCTSYPEAIALLATLLQATHTNALLVSTQKMLKHTLPLGSYLLKPVQRILKYHLLLENLRKHCNDQQVALAHELMKKVAHNIDQVQTKLDKARFVKELVGILDGWLGPDLSVLGDLLHEGRLLEHSKPRNVLLFQTMLIIAKPKEDKRLQFRAYIPCKNLMLVEHLPGEPVCFRVIPFDDPKGALQLTARNREEKRVWTQQIKKAMLQHYSDIPTRAMELVLQLGDEDERITDKQYWKRPANNSPIPEYLERRQQFRRSEMRMRSKKNLLKKDAAVPTPPVNGLLSTPSFRSYSSDLENPASATISNQHHQSSAVEDACKCDEVKRQLQEEMNSRPLPSDSTTASESSPPPKPARSRSETRCGPADEEEERLLKSLYERRKLSVPTKRGTKMKESIRSYNSTMIPKRISEIRKRRPKTLTSSSTFYTDLEVSSETNVTDHETTDPPSFSDQTTVVSPASPVEEDRQPATISGEDGGGEQKKDSEIISQLILDVQQFNKVLNKPVTKKKSFDASTCTRPTALLNSERKPEPPSTEPPCDDEVEENDTMRGSPGEGGSDKTQVLSGSDEAEPIYESLLRNVHVPYKYAPASLARHSLPCGEGSCPTNSVGSCPKLPDVLLMRRTRPESDYVTLAYSELGLLEGIAAEDAKSLQVKSNNQHKTPQLLRNSDTNISYHRDDNGQGKESDEDPEKLERSISPPTSPSKGHRVVVGGDSKVKQPFLERQGSLSMKTTAQKSILQRFISLHSTTSTAGTSSGSEGNLLHSLQRKLSEPNGEGGGSIGHIYKQGSMDLGSRIAHLDYADPKTLFFQNTAPSSAGSVTTLPMVGGGNLVNRVSMQLTNNNDMQQRDSVLASSSSSDSVCYETSGTGPPSSTNAYDDPDDEQCCFYERTVEECLEHDFRDSAVYSGDDNDRQQQHHPQQQHADHSDQPNDHLYEALTPVVPPNHQQRTSGPPPPIPAKPAHLGQLVKRQQSTVAISNSAKPATGNSSRSSSSSRGWVLQQVRRFQ